MSEAPRPAAARNAWIAVAAVALLLFVPTLHGGFVYDDHRFVEGNPHLREPSILWRAFTDPSSQTGDGTHAGLWRPLRTLSFAFDVAVLGGSAAASHAVNVLLHAAGSAVLTVLLLRWRLPPLAAAAGGVLYAAHPIQTESVAWISSRGDLLAALGVWTALVLDLGGRTRAAFLAGCAALLSKGEQAIVWPALLVLSRLAAGRAWRESLRGAAAPLAAAAAFVAIRHLLLGATGQEGGLGQGTAGLRVLGLILAHQTWQTAVPAGMLFDWQMPWDARPPAAAAVVVVGFLAALVHPRTRLGAAWFAVAIAPTWIAQAVVPLNILVADRFLLFALPGMSLLVARCVAERRAAAAPAFVAAAAFAAMTLGAAPVWADDASLWSRTAARVPDHWRANLWLAIDDLRAGRADEAEARLVVAARAAPADAKTRFFLAQCQEQSGTRTRDDAKCVAALDNYRAAIEAFGGPRAEDAAGLLPLALWAEADLTLLTGDADGARRRFDTLLAGPVPPLNSANRRSLDARLSLAARRAEIGLGPDVAARIRRWGAQP